MAKKLNS